jgi:hypothetical protein
MGCRNLEKENWRRFFDLISRTIQGQFVELEIAGPDFGDQVETDWALVEGLSYDEKSDILSILTSDVDHTISSPLEIVVMESGALLKMIGIKDEARHVQVVKFRAPLLLEARS